MEAGTGNYESKAKDCEKDRHSHFEGGSATENWKHHSKNTNEEEVMLHFVH